MDMLKDSVRSLYLRLFAASFGSALVTSVFGLIDAVMVGKYHGPDGTAALSVVNPIWSLMYGLGLLIGIGSSVLYAVFKGGGEKHRANEYFTTAVILGAVVSVTATVAVTIFQDPMMRFFGADDHLLGLAKQYFYCIKFAFPCCFFTHILASFLRNDGNPALATVSVIIGGILNAAGDYFFVFFCDMGIFGAGLATAIGLYVSNLIMLVHFLSKKNTLRLVRPAKLLHKIGKTAVSGLPSGISDFAIGVTCILFNRQIMAYLNTDALAVYGIITQITAFAQCCSYSIGQAAQPILSQNFGAGQHTRIRQCLRYGLITSGIVGAIWLLLCLLAPNMFVYLFMTPTDAVLEIAPAIIRIYGLSFLFLPFNIFATYYLQAMMKPYLSAAASLGRGVVISGITIMLLPVLSGGNGIWYAMLITESFVAVFCIFQIIRIVSRQKKAEKEEHLTTHI